MALNWSSAQPLPSGWEARWDSNYNRYYFIDHATQQTSWTDPRQTNAARILQPAPARMQPAPARMQPAPEMVPMRDLSSRQSSAQSYSGQTASTSRSQETNFQMSIDTSADDDDDEEWRNALLLSSMANNDKKKRLLFHEKVNMKEKFKREFKELDGVLVENTVEKHEYEEDIVRAVLSSLKDAHIEKERKKREEEQRKKREKEAEQKRKAAERKREIDRMRRELREKKEAEKKKAEMEAKKRALSQAAAPKPKATVTVQARPTSTQRVTQPEHTPQTTQKAKPTPAPVRASPTPVRSSPTPVRASATPKPSGNKQVYISSNRLQALGPQASLRQGPDRRNLIRYSTHAAGPNRSLVTGPIRTNCKGPSAVQAKISLSKGPQPSLRQGPQCRMVHAQARSNITGRRSPFVSAV